MESKQTKDNKLMETEIRMVVARSGGQAVNSWGIGGRCSEVTDIL